MDVLFEIQHHCLIGSLLQYFCTFCSDNSLLVNNAECRNLASWDCFNKESLFYCLFILAGSERVVFFKVAEEQVPERIRRPFPSSGTEKLTKTMYVDVTLKYAKC